MLSEKPWHPLSVVRLWLLLFVCLCIGALVGGLIRNFSGASSTGETSLLNLMLNVLSFHGAALVLIAFFLRGEHLSWSDAFGFSTPERGHALLVSLLIACIVLPIGWTLQSASAEALNALADKFPGFNVNAEDQQVVQMLKTTTSWSYRICLGATAILLAPAAEELLFRGVLYPTIKQCGYPRLALWGTSLFFALVHLNLATFVPLTFLAIVLTLLYERTNNLLAPITVHSLFNAANFGMLLRQQQILGQ
jgi:membrane protease YdiL (CAAX protease family)